MFDLFIYVSIHISIYHAIIYVSIYLHFCKLKAIFLNILTQCNCNSQVFLWNVVKLFSWNSTHIWSSETPPRGRWRHSTFCYQSAFLCHLLSRIVVIFLTLMICKKLHIQTKTEPSLSL